MLLDYGNGGVGECVVNSNVEVVVCDILLNFLKRVWSCI